MKTSNLQHVLRMISRWHLAIVYCKQHGPCGRLLTISAASRRSGVRGGRLKHVRRFTLLFEQVADLYAAGKLPLHSLYERR